MKLVFGKRFVLLVSAIVLAVLGAAHWWTYEEGKKLLSASDEHRVSLLAEVIRNGLRAIMLEGRGTEFQRFIDSIIAEDIEAVRIFSENGVVLNSTIAREVGTRVDPKHIAAFRDSRQPFFMHSLNGRDVYSTFFIINNEWPCQKCHGSWGKIRGILDLEIATREVSRGVAELRSKVAMSFVLSSAALIGLIGLVYRKTVRDPLAAAAAGIRGLLPNRQSRVMKNGQDAAGLFAADLLGLARELESTRGRLEQCRADITLQEEKMASLGEVAAAVAHEIKNPLAGISGALQVMAEDIPQDDPRKMICNEIQQEISRLDEAVKDFLLYARPPEPSLIPTDIHAIIEKVRERIILPAARADIRIETALTAAAPLALIDPDQIERVFYSIAMHGINAMPNGGVLTMSTANSHDSQELEIVLSDTGAGIPASRLDHVFKPFFSTRHLAGGLRLAICKAIVEKHGGTIGVRSAQDRGTSFLISLPAKG
ncbi:MAG: ATP-binding protein [Thermodesulfovibrionales bacterium]